MKNFLRFIICLLIGLSIFSSCEYEPVTPITQDFQETGNLILTFSISNNGVNEVMTVGPNVVTGMVNNDFDVTNVSIDLTISNGATISPDPSTITDVSSPVQFTVTAENGATRNYTVDIDVRPDNLPSAENFILSFEVREQNFFTAAEIDQSAGTIFQRMPPNIDLTSVRVDGTISNDATISPDFAQVTDFSSPVSFTVTSESGHDKVYTVTMESMSNQISERCDTQNAAKWFGGDDRTGNPSIQPFDRNVGTGQTLILDEDTIPYSFTVILAGGFEYASTGAPYTQGVDIKLTIRGVNDQEIVSRTIRTPNNFTGGDLVFNLRNEDIFLEGGQPYRFEWYLITGETLGVNSSSPGDNTTGNTGFCYQGGWSGEARLSRGNDLDDNDPWGSHPWNFNLAFEGLQ